MFMDTIFGDMLKGVPNESPSPSHKVTTINDMGITPPLSPSSTQAAPPPPPSTQDITLAPSSRRRWSSSNEDPSCPLQKLGGQSKRRWSLITADPIADAPEALGEPIKLHPLRNDMPISYTSGDVSLRLRKELMTPVEDPAEGVEILLIYRQVGSAGLTKGWLDRPSKTLSSHCHHCHPHHCYHHYCHTHHSHPYLCHPHHCHPHHSSSPLSP